MTSFHYAGIQLFPGVWRGDPDATVDHYVGEPYDGELPLVEVGRAADGLDLDGKAAVITGGGSGIGAAIALDLAAHGMQVVLADIDRDAAQSVAAEVIRRGGRALAVAVDVSDSRSVEALAAYLPLSLRWTDSTWSLWPLRDVCSHACRNGAEEPASRRGGFGFAGR